MKHKIALLAIAIAGASSLSAQNLDFEHWPVTLGLKAGIPVTQMFSSGTSSFLSGSNGVNSAGFPGSAYTSSVPRYEFGASAEFRMPFHLRLEVDGLYKPGGFNNSLSGSMAGSYQRTRFNQWEIPGVLKYNVSVGHFRPFIDFGASYRHISTIDQQTSGGFQTAYLDNSSAIRNRNSFGGVAGFGMTFKKGPFELTPEARYTRWANSSFSAPGLKSNKDQGDVLLGIAF